MLLRENVFHFLQVSNDSVSDNFSAPKGESWYGSLARYVKLRVAQAPGMPGTFSPPSRVKRSRRASRHVHDARAVMHAGSLTSGIFWSRWRGNRFRHYRRMRNPQFYVSGNRPMGVANDWKRLCIWDTLKFIRRDLTENTCCYGIRLDVHLTETLGPVFISTETDESNVTKCILGKAWDASDKHYLVKQAIAISETVQLPRACVINNLFEVRKANSIHILQVIHFNQDLWHTEEWYTMQILVDLFITTGAHFTNMEQL